MINHYAIFDYLSISGKLQDGLKNFSEYEVQLFSYLSCLLSLFKKKNVSEWEYSFVATEYGAPYSVEINHANSYFIENAYVSLRDDGYMELSKDAFLKYENLKQLYMYRERELFIDGACSSLLALPIGQINAAIRGSEEIKSSIQLSQNEPLFTEHGIRSIHDQFVFLSKEVGLEITDLMIPAVVWVSYLYEIGKVKKDY